MLITTNKLILFLLILLIPTVAQVIYLTIKLEKIRRKRIKKYGNPEL